MLPAQEMFTLANVSVPMCTQNETYKNIVYIIIKNEIARKFCQIM